MRRTAALIVNRAAHRGGASLEREKSLLRGGGLRLVEERVSDPAEIAARLHRHRGADLFLVAGGDGTLNTAAEPLLELRRPLGILPLGTANNLARTLGIPTDPMEACEVILAGHSRRIDLGEVNGKAFFTVAHLGLGAEVIAELSARDKRRWGLLAFLPVLVRALRETASFRAHLRWDAGAETVASIQVAVGNGRRYGAVFRVAADARVDDRRLHAFSLAPRGLAGLLLLAPALMTGRCGDKRGVRHLEGSTLRIETDRPLRVATDGELTTHTPATFRVRPGALSVLAPADPG